MDEMKRYLALVLALCLCFALAACGGTEETQAPGTVAPESEAPESIPPETVDPGTETENEISFETVTVVDNDECAILITEVSDDFTLKAELENKSTEKTYMFAISSAAVDGLQTDPFFASEVAPGKKSIEQISFMDDDLSGNVNFTDIELAFRVYDSDDWSADDVADATVHIYPFGEDKAETFTRTPLDTDNVILDNEYVTATVIGCSDDPIWGYSVNLFLQNKTDVEVMFSADNASVNGYMADPFWATTVQPGKCAFNSMMFSDSTLEEIGVTEIENIEFVLSVGNNEDWTAEDFANEEVILNP